MEPICKNHFDHNIHFFIGLLNDLPNFKYHRDLFITLFEKFSTELARIACTPMLLNDYVVLHQEYKNTIEGSCPFGNKSTVKKIQELLFYGITTHPQFDKLPLIDVINLFKSGPPDTLKKAFINHPAIKGISKKEHKAIRQKAETNKESAFIKFWFQCTPDSEDYIPKEPREYEHTQILRKMSLGAPDMPLDEIKKGALYLAISEKYYNSAVYHLNDMTTLSFEDAVFYLCTAIKTGNLKMVELILNKAFDKSEYSSISKQFECMKNDSAKGHFKTFKKLASEVIIEEQHDVLSILLAYESIFFEDNIIEQLLEDLIGDWINIRDYDTIKSFYCFNQIELDELIKQSAKLYLSKWIVKSKSKKVFKFLKNFPKCSDVALKFIIEERTSEDLIFYIEKLRGLNISIDITSLMTHAYKEEKPEKMKLLIEEHIKEIGLEVSLNQDILIYAVFSNDPETVKLVLNHGVSISYSEKKRLSLLQHVIKYGNVEILKYLEDYLKIDLKSFLLRKLNKNWTEKIFLKIIFKKCKNLLSMMNYFSDLLKTCYLTRIDLIEPYIQGMSAAQFHEKAFFISLICKNSDEQPYFLEVSKKTII